jgi:hypothetical protein
MPSLGVAARIRVRGSVEEGGGGMVGCVDVAVGFRGLEMEVLAELDMSWI